MAGSSRPPTSGQSMPLVQRVRIGIGAVALLALLIFVFQNLDSADINFLWFEWHTRLAWALLAAAAFGAVSALLVTVVRPRGGDDARPPQS